MDSLLNAIARDTCITPYQGESDTLYKSRLIYSAMSEWIRYTTQDYMIKKTYSKSKQYVLIRCGEILNAFMDCEPECKSWFLDLEKESDSYFDSIQVIRQKMIDSGELLEVGEKNYLSVPQYEEIICAIGYARVIGFSSKEQRVNNIGLTRIVRATKEGNRFFVDNHYNIEEYLKWTFNKGGWSEISDTNRFEFFDITSKKIPSQSWADKPIKSNGKHLGRISLFNGYNEY